MKRRQGEDEVGPLVPSAALFENYNLIGLSALCQLLVHFVLFDSIRSQRTVIYDFHQHVLDDREPSHRHVITSVQVCFFIYLTYIVHALTSIFFILTYFVVLFFLLYY